MKFIIDNALSPQIAIGLVEAGYDAIHVRDLNMGTSPDIDIFNIAIEQQRTIIFDKNRIRTRMLPIDSNEDN